MAPVVTAQTQSSHMGRTAAIVVGVIVIVILTAGFVIYIPATSVGYEPVPVTGIVENTFATSSIVSIVNIVEHTFETSSITEIPIPEQTTLTAPVFLTSDIMLKPTYYDAHPALLTVGTDVQISWKASENVNIYIFSSTDFDTYAASNGVTTNHTVATDSGAVGTLAFHISGTDNYYLVIENPNIGVLGVGAANVGYTTTGTETYPTITTTNLESTVTYATSTLTVVTSTSTAIYTTSTPTVVTSTTTSTTTSTCSHYFWKSLAGAKGCP
jgi:hypothetical protein